MRTLVTTLTLIASAAPAAAQGQPSPWAQERERLERRARRDEAVKLAGPDGGVADFVKIHGDAAAKAVLHYRNRPARQGEPGAAELVDYFKSGRLDQLSNPAAVVELFARHGPDVQTWVIAHHDQLCEPAALEAFLESPLDFSWELRDLGQAAEAVRARRAGDSPLARLQGMPRQTWGAAALVAAILVLAAYRARRRSREGRP